MKKVWEELGDLRHKIINSNTVISGLIPVIKIEKEKIASYGRKINVLIEKVELIEQKGETK